MGINQKLACCVCNRPQRVPCGRCNTNDCTCTEFEIDNVQTPKPPVTSLTFEVADITISSITTGGRSDTTWTHYWPKKLQFANEHGNQAGPAGNRMVFSHFMYWVQGYRFGDLIRQLGGYLSECYVGTRIGQAPLDWDYEFEPCPGFGQGVDFDSTNTSVPLGECPPLPPGGGGNCAEAWCEWYENLLLQGYTPSRTWQWQPDKCINQSLGGCTYTIEMDWPCVETQEAFDKAQEKYDFGQAQLEVATNFCANNPGDDDCGGPDYDGGCAKFCHPAAKDIIGAQPPSLSACIEACPSQVVCDYDDAVYPEVQYPDGAVDPFGWYVPQQITCLTGGADGTEGDACSFNIQSIADNWSAIQSCYHQCGYGCPPQQCCLVECFDTDCCDQLLYNPNDPTETVFYDDDGCITDGSGVLMGGWSTKTGLRCDKPEFDCFTYINGVPELKQKGCRRDPAAFLYRVCENDDVCCRNGEGPIGGDILNWSIPRMPHPDISIHKYGQYPPPQGIYPVHCPDTLDPFIPRPSRILGDAKCDAKQAPVANLCRGSTTKNPGLGGNPGEDCVHDGSGDRHNIYIDDHNPRGMICGPQGSLQGGVCLPCVSWDGGGTAQACDDLPPGGGNHNEGICGNNPLEDEYNRQQAIAGGQPPNQVGFCNRSGCYAPSNGNCRKPSSQNCAFTCFQNCPEPQAMCFYQDGTIEEEMGLQLLQVYCGSASWETKRTLRLDANGEPVLSPDLTCIDGGRELYAEGRAFQIRLTYDGTGDGAIFPAVSRISTNNTYELAQEDPLDQNSCIFGEYEMLVGGTGWTPNLQPTLPYLSTDPGQSPFSIHSDWAGLPESCYYDTQTGSGCDSVRSRQFYQAHGLTSGPGRYGPKVTVL